MMQRELSATKASIKLKFLFFRGVGLIERPGTLAGADADADARLVDCICVRKTETPSAGRACCAERGRRALVGLKCVCLIRGMPLQSYSISILASCLRRLAGEA